MRSCAVILSALFITCVSSADGPLSGVEKSVLENGATVVCKHIPESPIVAIQVRVMSGLSNEGKYAGSGISHFLEHLIFKGTRGKTSEEVGREIKALGGMVNGATGLDSAEYSIIVPRDNFDKALGLIVDMVLAPEFTEEEVSKEREVILKEIKMNEDEPSARQLELLFAQAYRDSVYKNPVIGYPERLAALARQDILDYHGAAYTADRIVVGIAGGVPAGQAISAASAKLGGYKRGASWWPSGNPDEPRQLEARTVTFPADVTLGYIAMAFHTTSLYSDELYAGDVLSILLGEGDDSRLFRRLVKEKQLLYSISSVNYTPRYPGLFIITGVGEPGKMDAARREILAVIEELRSAKSLDEELLRARNTIISEYYHTHESAEDIASSLTTSQLMTGDPAFFEKYVEGVRNVGKESAQRMLSKYLYPENSTTVLLMPRGAAGKEDAAQAAEGDKEEEKTLILDNGMRILVKRRPRLPVVSVVLAVPGGVRAEDTSNNGISNLTAAVMLKGAKKLREGDIVPAVEKMGGTISPFSGMNSMGLVMSLLAKDLPRGMDIFETVIKEASFPAEEIEKARKKALAALREQENDIFDSGMNALRALIYKYHPYGMDPLGRPGTISSFSRDDILEFYRGRFVPEGAVLSIVGDIDVLETLDDMEKRFAGWQAVSEPISAKAVPALKGKETKDIDMPMGQALFLVGFQGVTIDDDRQYALSLISSVLSGSDGIMFYALREAEGLTYASGALSVPGVDKGYFAIYAATTDGNLAQVKKSVIDILGKVAAGDISDEEIASSRNRLIAQYATSLETNTSLAMTTALDELYGLGFGHYKKFPGKVAGTGREEIKKCAKEFLNLDNCAIVTVRPRR